MLKNKTFKIVILIVSILVLIFIVSFFTSKDNSDEIIEKINTVKDINDKEIDDEYEQEEIIDNSIIGTLTIPKIHLNNIII